MAGTVIDSLIVTLGLDGSDYKKGQADTEKVNKNLRDDSDFTAKYLADKGKKAGSYFSGIKVEMLGLLAVVMLGGKTLESFLSKMGAAQAATARLAQVSGTTPSLLSGLQNLSTAYGGSASSASSAVSSIFNGLNNFQQTGHPNDVVNALIHMGVNPLGKDGKIRDTTEITEDVAAWMKKHTEGQDLVYGQMLGFDPSFTNSLIQAPDVPGGIKADSTITPLSAADAEKIVTAENSLGIAVGKLDTDIMTNLAPMFLGLIKAVTDLVNWFDKPAPPKVKDTTDQWIPHPGGRGGLILNPDYSPPMGSDNGVWVQTQSGRSVPRWVPLTDDQIRRQEQVESGGRQVDAKGNPILGPVTKYGQAVGIMQLLPSTAQSVASANGIAWDEHKFRYDKNYNEHLGILYMEQLLVQYHGDYQKALAAYNWGPGNLDKDISDSKKTGKDWMASLPSETGNYLQQILGITPAAAATRPVHAPTTIHTGPITIHTKATDAGGIAKSLSKKLQSTLAINVHKGIST